MPPRHPHRHRRSGFAGLTLAAALAGAFPALAQIAPDQASNSIDTSINASQGVIGVNQQVGDSNNQANITSLSVSSGDPTAALARVLATQRQSTDVPPDAPTDGANSIDHSINGTQGIVQINQVAGHANNQLNIVAIAFAPDASFSSALTDVELQQVKSPGPATPTVSQYDGQGNSLNDSLNNFRGIAQISQVVGDANQITNVVAVAIGGGGG